MNHDLGNYVRHAYIWDWGGYDRSAEYEYWCNYAGKYGRNVLIPMCALGETGAYMARHGFNVTAFDITKEMVSEGKKRFGDVQGLQLFHGDVTDFRFDIPPVDFCFCGDFGHIHTMENIKKALVCINYHLRDGGCLIIETGLPYRESDYSPLKTFYPSKQVYPNLKVWKTGSTSNDAGTGRCYISQTVYIEDESRHVESFDHSFYMQSYPRDEWIKALNECGFHVKNEYRNQEKEPWREGDGYLIVEAVKSIETKERYSSTISFDYLQTPIFTYQNVSLYNDVINLEQPNTGLFPFYRFDILADGNWVGYIFIRIGYSIRAYYSGQIGYGIKEEFRCRGYMTKACLALKPFLKQCGFKHVLITTDEQNTASRRVCEKIGALLLETIDTPTWTGMYKDGQRRTCIYEWNIEEIKSKKITELTFSIIKKQLPQFKYTSLEPIVYENIEQYKTLQNDTQAIFLYGENKEAEVYELHFAVNDMELLIDIIKTLPSATLVTMIPTEYKQEFILKGFTVYGELQDYWIDYLTNEITEDLNICFINKDEYIAASEVTKSVKWQSREFHGESAEWIEAWVKGEDPNAKDCASTDCNVIVHKIDGVIVGVVCVALYGHNSEKGTVVWIREIAVKPDCQGRGIGRTLINQALSYGVSKGAKRAFLMADNCNIRAIKLYKSVGFVGITDGVQIDMIYPLNL